MPFPVFETNAKLADWSARIVDTTVVAASPATAGETIIASLTIPDFGGIPCAQKIYLQGWAALTIGTSGTNLNLRIRQTNVAGNVVTTTGNLTGGVAAGNLVAQDVCGSDPTPGVATYVLTAQLALASAASTVSAVELLAIVV